MPITGFVSGQSASFAGYTNSFSYNKRLQPINMSASAPNQTVFSIGYDFHLGNGNNGNVYGITNYKDNSRDQSFTYDALNRLTSAQNAGTNCSASTVNGKTEYWGNSYGYDAWGNLVNKTITKCGAENLPLISNPLNRADNGQAPQNGQVPSLNYQYDAAGNMIWDATENVALNYDQENRVTGAGGYTYTYDADGNRVKKANGSTGTLYWYMTPGIVAESDLSGNLKSEYVFFNEERVARRDFPAGSVAYYFSDHLKTASVITDASDNIKSESDFYPWGGELQFVNSDTNHYKFTGKERDQETGLDYFGARYYSNSLGRFITPDWAAKPVAIPYAVLGDPQSLNLYTYVRNIPTSSADTDGHCPVPGLCIALEVINGIFRDGGVKPYAKNVAIGVAKGTGSFVVNTGKAVAAGLSNNPAAGVAIVTSPSPKALQPSNQTQTQASIVTQGTLGAASGVATGPAIGALEGASMASSTTSLFRAVGTAEAESIESLSAFSAAPNGTEFKGFFFNQSDAESFGSMSTKAGWRDTSVYSTEAPTDLVDSSPVHNAQGEGPGTLIPNDKLNQLSTPKKVDP